jgi:hypothetical protein
MVKKKGQISIEYIVVMGFILMGIITIISIALYYGYAVSDRVALNQINNFGSEIINNAEAVYYSGYPSRITITPYLPDGVKAFNIYNDSLVVTLSTSSGKTDVPFSSKVLLEQKLLIAPTSGVKKILIEAIPGPNPGDPSFVRITVNKQ